MERSSVSDARPATGRPSRAVALGLALVVALGAAFGSVDSAGAETAQPRAPRPACVPGATPEERLTHVVAIMIGLGEGDDLVALRASGANATGATAGDPPWRCAGARALGYVEQDALWQLLVVDPTNKDVVYVSFTEGTSLTESFAAFGVDRAALLDGLSNTYLVGADGALADGAIDAGQRELLSSLVLAHFDWLIDWAPGQPVRVATGDVNNDGRADLFAADPGDAEPGSIDQLFACVAGPTAEERVDGIIAILIALVAGPGATDAAGNRLADHPVCDDVAFVLARFESPLPDLLGMTPSEIQAAYEAGSSLAELAEEQGIGPDPDLVIVVALIDVWEHAYYLAADAGDLGEVDISAIDTAVDYTHPDLYRLIHHRQGEPLRPVDPFGVI